jgi:hypothetical protein
MTALSRPSSNCKRKTRPLVRESAPHQRTLTVIKIWSYAPDGCFIPRQTGRLTVGRNKKTRSTVSQSGVAVAEARGQVGKSEEGKRPPLESVTGRLLKTQQAEKT